MDHEEFPLHCVSQQDAGIVEQLSQMFAFPLRSNCGDREQLRQLFYNAWQLLTSPESQPMATPFPQPDLARAFDLVMQLMPIPGKSGEEGRVVEFITDQLRQAGVPAVSITNDDAHTRS